MPRTRKPHATKATCKPSLQVRLDQQYLMLTEGARQFGDLKRRVEKLERQATFQKFLNKIVLSELFDVNHRPRWYVRAWRRVVAWWKRKHQNVAPFTGQLPKGKPVSWEDGRGS